MFAFLQPGAHLGPIWGPILRDPFRGIGRGPGTHFLGIHLGGSVGALGTIWRPKADILEAEGRHYGGRRPIFWRDVGGRSPPTNCGGCGGAPAPPPGPEMFNLDLLPENATVYKNTHTHTHTSTTCPKRTGNNQLCVQPCGHATI